MVKAASIGAAFLLKRNQRIYRLKSKTKF